MREESLRSFTKIGSQKQQNHKSVSLVKCHSIAVFSNYCGIYSLSVLFNNYHGVECLFLGQCYICTNKKSCVCTCYCISIHSKLCTCVTLLVNSFTLHHNNRYAAHSTNHSNKNVYPCASHIVLTCLLWNRPLSKSRTTRLHCPTRSNLEATQHFFGKEDSAC